MGKIGAWIRTRWYELVLMLLLAATIVLMLVTFWYIDLVTLTAWSYNLWDLVVEGRLQDFYVYTAENIRGSYAINCAGSWLGLIPIAVWNLPVWIICRINGVISVNNALCLYWTKIFYIAMTMVAAHYSSKVVAHVTKDRKRAWLAWPLVLGSGELLISTCYAGQDEIIYLALMVMAVYYWMQKKQVKMVICGSISVILCPIILIPYLILIMMREKRVVFILAQAAVPFLVNAVFNFAYRNDAVYQYATSEMPGYVPLSTYIMEGVNLNGIGTGYSSLWVAGIIYVIALYVSYVKKPAGEAESERLSVFLVAIVMSASVLFWGQYAYRMCLAVPFWILLALISGEKQLNMNLFLLMLLNYLRLVDDLALAPKISTSNILPLSWIIDLCEKNGSTNYTNGVALYDVLSAIFPDMYTYYVVINTIQFAVIVILLYNGSLHAKEPNSLGVNAKVSVLLYVLCPVALVAGFFAAMLFYRG